MKNYYKILVIAFAIFSFSTNTYATHLSGLDISYECVGQDSFLITLNIYRDCSGISAPTNAPIVFTSTCGGNIPSTLVLQNPSGTEVSQLCSSSIMNSTCNGGTLPGMQHYIYSGIVVLNQLCSTWEVSWGSCCRNTTINVTNQPGSFINASINTTDFPCNNSPKFAESYVRYVPFGQLVSHSFSVTEPDGDSLTYHFTEPLQSAYTSVPYNSGYTYQQPIPGITLDTASGLIQFTPLILGNYVVAVKVCEYELGTGILKGCVTRDIEYVVINSANNNVQADTITNNQADGFVIGSYDVEICLGDSVSFDIIFTDPDVADSIFTTSNIATVLPGATLTATGGNPDTVSISWRSQGAIMGQHTFFINAIDDGCPIYSALSVPVNIHILNNVFAGPDQSICFGTQWTGFPTNGGNSFNWTVLSGSPIDTNSASPNYNMTCSNCQFPQVSPSVSTTYVVTSNLSGGCDNTDTVLVNVAPDFTLTMPNDTLICSIDDYQLQTFTNQSFSYNYQWSPSNLLDFDTIPYPITNPSSPTTYTVTVTSSAGCSKSNSMKITLSAPFPKNNFVIGDTVLCNGISSQLGVGFGIVDYSGCDTSSVGCNGVNQTGVIGTSSNTNNNYSYPAIYGGTHWGAKHQIMYKATELSSLGIVDGGFINSISFFIDNLSTVSGYTDFTIKIGCTSNIDVTSGWETNLTSVYYSSLYTAVAGWNTHSFNSPYLWDGTSNIVVEICFNNTGTATNAQIKYTATGFQSVLYNFSNNVYVCSYYPSVGSGAYLSNKRPNTQFNFCTGIDSNALTYNWSPSIGLSTTNIQNPIASPTASVNYQVVVTDAQGICKDTLHHSVDVVSQYDAGFYTQSPYCINDTLDTLLPLVGNGVFTGNAINSLGVFDPAIAGVGIWPINYNISSPAGCANDSTINVEVLALPDASIQYQEVCETGSSVLLIPITLGGIFSGPGITDSINGVFDPAGLAPGIYNIEYSLSQGCNVSEFTGIKVIEPFNFLFDNTQYYICQGTTFDLSAVYTLSSGPNQGAGPIMEAWSSSNGIIDSSGVFDATNASVGTYIVSLTISDTLGNCSHSETVEIKVIKTYYPSFPFGLVFCETDGLVTLVVDPKLFGSGASFTQFPIPPLLSTDTLNISPFGNLGKFNTQNSGLGSWEISVTYINSSGCIGVTTDTIYVLPAPTNNNVIQNQTVLTAALGGGYTYQWLDCSNNMAPVPGATNQSFTPAVTGDYAVEISAGNCSITSGCYYGWSVGVEQVDNELGITVFPNPTKDAIQIDKGNNKNVEIQIIDFTGELIWKQSLQNPVTTIDLSSYANGVYIIKMSTENGSSTQKIIKN